MDTHGGKTIWFTGLSGSGKSTLSAMLKTSLELKGCPVVLLDGDTLRSGLNRDLGFSPLDRAENIRRAAEVAKILCDEGHTVISAFITPLEAIRQAVRGLFRPDEFVEVFLDCPLTVCESRDPKGLYRRARKGDIPEFTGISSPFERPCASELVVPTGGQTVEDSLHVILNFLENRFSVPTPDCSVMVRNQFSRRTQRKMAVIGLDCVPPSLIFEEWGNDLPMLRALMEHGTWGPLQSTDPPITIPAWTTITTGKDPGELGLYGFRNREANDYREMVTANASHVKVPRVWSYLEDAGKTSILLGIPQTYPPEPHNGITVAGFPVPDSCTEFTYPAELADELRSKAGGAYLLDVKDFRKRAKESLLSDMYTMVERRFRLAADFVLHRPWEFFMMVEIAPDRLHHGFWRYLYGNQPGLDPYSASGNVMKDFYKFIDSRVGSLVALLGDDTTVMVVSDHGARNSMGGVCINEWLIRNGFLVLRQSPDAETPLTPDLVDWARTAAWSEGGYYARIFLNVKGREPQGFVEPSDYEALRWELQTRLQSMINEDGKPLENRVVRPQDIYPVCRSVPPDLMVYFDGLSRRSIGTVGHGDILRSPDSDGLDDANHDPQGIFIMTRLSDLRYGIKMDKRVDTVSCLDITPTILHEFDLPIPNDLRGSPVDVAASSGSQNETPSLLLSSNEATQPDPDRKTVGFTAEEEEMVKKRLMDLGYV